MNSVDKHTFFTMKFRDSLRKYDTYRGAMRVRVNDTGIQCLNLVGIDDYVQGVIPMERCRAGRLKRSSLRPCPPVPTVPLGQDDRLLRCRANQRQPGLRRVQRRIRKTNTAAQETAGMILWYGTQIANTYFFDTGGGATENSEYAWPTTGGNPARHPLPARIQDKDANGVPYDINSSSYSWKSAQFTMAQLSNIYKQDSRTDVGTITNLPSVAASRGASTRSC